MLREGEERGRRIEIRLLDHRACFRPRRCGTHLQLLRWHLSQHEDVDQRDDAVEKHHVIADRAPASRLTDA